jgi:hypothetical protein
MGKADQLAGSQKGSLGFALTALQRRLASSPEAIFSHSLVGAVGIEIASLHYKDLHGNDLAPPSLFNCC